MQKTPSGRHKQVMDPGMLTGWQDVSMYNIPLSTRRKLCVTFMANLVRHECSRILHCPSPPIVNHSIRHYLFGDARFKERFERVLEKESVEMVPASFAHVERYVIRYSRQEDPQITERQRYRVSTPLPHAITHIINSSYVTELFYGGELNVGFVWLAIQRQHEVYWAYADNVMEDPFLWYDWHTGRMVELPLRECLEGTFS